jgi:hypothetical protein
MDGGAFTLTCDSPPEIDHPGWEPVHFRHLAAKDGPGVESPSNRRPPIEFNLRL